MPYSGKYFYHFTHLDNLESIAENGLLATNRKVELGIEHINVANNNIQTRRHTMEVPCGRGGTIHDYVPFYFTSLNPMLLSLLNNKVVDQQLIVFLAIPIEKIQEDNVVFTNRAANTNQVPIFFEDIKDLEQLNWKLINSTKWGNNTSQDRNYRMAEVLVHERMPIEWVDHYVVFNDIACNKIKEIYGEKDVKICYDGTIPAHFYFTKISFKNRENETLVTGPLFLKNKYEEAIQNINASRVIVSLDDKKFQNIRECISQLSQNFCAIKELEDIDGLETDNSVHNDNVKEHTIKVANTLKNYIFYTELAYEDKKIVKLAACLHDIGKGPKEKWKDHIQSVYQDHPADAIPMLERILIDDFIELSAYEIKMLCLLVIYHDLIGDILFRNRGKVELENLNLSQNEFNMLAAITMADINAINSNWGEDLEEKILILREELIE